MRASAQTAGRSTFAALRERNYCLYWIGLVFYVLGHRAEYVTFAWITWEVTRDPMALGYLGLAQGVPLVIFQLCGGVLADRINRLRLLIATQILVALTLTVAFGLTVLGVVRFEHLLALAALSDRFCGSVGRGLVPRRRHLSSVRERRGTSRRPTRTSIASHDQSIRLTRAIVHGFSRLAGR